MADDFYKDEEVTEEVENKEEPETIKVGDKEYTQDELQKIVGLGEIGLEAEEKYKTKIDRVWPEYTKGQQRLQDLERKVEEYEKEQTDSK